MNQNIEQNMKFYLAPMEGVTSYIYRAAYRDFFHNIDKYFTPFIAPNQTGTWKSKDKNDILPEHNEGLRVVPQILTNKAEDFIRTAKDLAEYGYDEVNLNLGCPSGTVVAKGKGSGFLAQRDQLNFFLENICSGIGKQMKLSIKTRLGKDNAEGFFDLIAMYNQYPLEEVIIHPRVQKDLYNNHPNLDMFREALSRSKHPVCYNGDIFTTAHYHVFQDQFPSVDTIMLGRGLIANPGLIKQIKEPEWSLDNDTFRKFHDRLLGDYKEILSGDTNVLYKMKELWYYMIWMFPNSESYAKKIRKCKHLSEYKDIVAQLLSELTIGSTVGFLTND